MFTNSLTEIVHDSKQSICRDYEMFWYH